MYLLLLLTAILRPRLLYRRISCQHPNQQSRMKDAGMDKMFWCDDCGYTGFAVSGKAL